MTGGAWGVGFTCDRAYVAGGSTGLRVVNAADPAAPVEEGFYNTVGYGADLAASGSYAYLADRAGGMAILRLNAPACSTYYPFIRRN